MRTKVETKRRAERENRSGCEKESQKEKGKRKRRRKEGREGEWEGESEGGRERNNECKIRLWPIQPALAFTVNGQFFTTSLTSPRQFIYHLFVSLYGADWFIYVATDIGKLSDRVLNRTPFIEDNESQLTAVQNVLVTPHDTSRYPNI